MPSRPVAKPSAPPRTSGPRVRRAARTNLNPSASSDGCGSNGGPLCARVKIAPSPPRGTAPITITRPRGLSTRSASRTSVTRSSGRIVARRPPVSSTIDEVEAVVFERQLRRAARFRRRRARPRPRRLARAHRRRFVGHDGDRAPGESDFDGDRAQPAAVGAADLQQLIAHFHGRHRDSERVRIGLSQERRHNR